MHMLRHDYIGPEVKLPFLLAKLQGLQEPLPAAVATEQRKSLKTRKRQEMGITRLIDTATFLAMGRHCCIINQIAPACKLFVIVIRMPTSSLRGHGTRPQTAAPAEAFAPTRNDRTMKVAISQFYVQQGAEFPFSYKFQRFLSQMLSSKINTAPTPDPATERYSTLIVRLSAKHGLLSNEILGPALYEKDKEIEFSLFLPYNAISKNPHPAREAIRCIVEGINLIYSKLGLDHARASIDVDVLMNSICSDRNMFRSDINLDHDGRWLLDVKVQMS